MKSKYSLNIVAQGERELVMTRTFDAPRELVFDAMTKPVFEEKDGATTLTTTMLYASRESRDAVMKSGMERGVAAGYDRLDDIFASIAEGTAG